MVSIFIHWLFRAIMLLAIAAILVVWNLYHETNQWLAIFLTLFILRYTRLFGHCLGYLIYRPSTVPLKPTIRPSDATVILPTVDPNGPDFMECVRSILQTHPASIIVVTVGLQLKKDCKKVLQALKSEAGTTTLSVSAIAKPSKRRQIAHVMPFVTTSITILADDHVFWPAKFLPAILAPFEDDKVGAVATKKRVRRDIHQGLWSWGSMVNFIACNYLARHNFELGASNAIDGGVFVVSGRTAAYRTSFLADPELLKAFCNESFFFGLFGGKSLGADDNNLLSRSALKKGWLIRFQDTPDATIETTLGEWPKFSKQITRWARTTFRSNPVMLRDPNFLTTYTWSAYMVYWAGITNFAILWDGALLGTLVRALQQQDTGSSFIGLDSAACIALFVLWLVFTKIIKIMPLLVLRPADLCLVPVQIAFAYIHSLYKLWALLTFWDCEWSGRNLNEVNAKGEDSDSCQELETIIG